MRLHDFILANREELLTEWEAFATTLTPASITMDVEALRDHAGEMLTAIAEDLKSYQSESEQAEKSKGDAPDTADSEATAAEVHGARRAQSGFTTEQMVAEYRALRASVLRLWTRERGELEEPHRTLISRIAVSAMRTTLLVGDLLDFTRSRLGGGIAIDRAEVDLGKLVHDVVDEITAAHPEGDVQVEAGEGEMGRWDAARISQALTNLTMVNAIEHGAPETPVRVDLDGDAEDVSIMIHNRGVVIPADRLDGIFNPMKPSATPPEALSPWSNRKPRPGTLHRRAHRARTRRAD